jgi:hypothetical protein
MQFPLKSLLLAAALAFGGSTQASAAVACAGSMDNFSPQAIDCNGFFDGNVLSNNSGDVMIQEAAVEDLLGVNFDPFNFNSFPKIDNLNGATTLNFGSALTGMVVVGIHFGNGNGNFPENAVGNSTGFFLFNFVNPTSSISFTIPASSASVIYQGPPPEVPEPGTWALMLLGFGAVGFALRRRGRVIPQAA